MNLSKPPLSRLDIYWGSLKVESIDFYRHLQRDENELSEALRIATRTMAENAAKTKNAITRYTIVHSETYSLKHDRMKPVARYNYLGQGIAL